MPLAPLAELLGPEVQCVGCAATFPDLPFNSHLDKCGHRYCITCQRQRRRTAQTGCHICFPELSLFDQRAMEGALYLEKLAADDKASRMKPAVASREFDLAMQAMKLEQSRGDSPKSFYVAAIPVDLDLPEASLAYHSQEFSSETVPTARQHSALPDRERGSAQYVSTAVKKGLAAPARRDSAPKAKGEDVGAPAAAKRESAPKTKGDELAAPAAAKRESAPKTKGDELAAPAAAKRESAPKTKGDELATPAAAKRESAPKTKGDELATPAAAKRESAPKTKGDELAAPAAAKRDSAPKTKGDELAAPAAAKRESAPKATGKELAEPASTKRDSVSKATGKNLAAFTPAKRDFAPKTPGKALAAPPAAKRDFAPKTLGKALAAPPAAKRDSALKTSGKNSTDAAVKGSAASRIPGSVTLSVGGARPSGLSTRKSSPATTSSKTPASRPARAAKTPAAAAPAAPSTGKPKTPAAPAPSAAKPKTPAAPAPAAPSAGKPVKRPANTRPSALVQKKAKFQHAQPPAEPPADLAAPPPRRAVAVGPGIINCSPPRAARPVRYSSSFSFLLEDSTASSTGGDLDETLTLVVDRSKEEVDRFIATGRWGPMVLPPPTAFPSLQAERALQERLRLQTRLHELDQDADRIRAVLEFKVRGTVAGRKLIAEPSWMKTVM